MGKQDTAHGNENQFIQVVINNILHLIFINSATIL